MDEYQYYAEITCNVWRHNCVYKKSTEAGKISKSPLKEAKIRVTNMTLGCCDRNSSQNKVSGPKRERERERERGKGQKRFMANSEKDRLGATNAKRQ